MSVATWNLRETIVRRLPDIRYCDALDIAVSMTSNPGILVQCPRDLTCQTLSSIAMNKPPYISLQHSESIVTTAAANIYAAYIMSNRVTEGEEDQWMTRAVEEAIWIAQRTDASVQSDGEM